MLFLPESLREELRRPFGKVLAAKDAAGELRKARRPLVAVGDQCICSLVASGVAPDISVFDFKIRREEIAPEMKKALAPYVPEAYVVRSAPGTISDELSEAVGRVLAEGRGAIFVVGEDDLSALLVIANAAAGTLVYGQPDAGAVIVPLGSGEAKRRALALLGRMERG
jgi:uncharacterized protein (UPF0218 family)